MAIFYRFLEQRVPVYNVYELAVMPLFVAMSLVAPGLVKERQRLQRVLQVSRTWEGAPSEIWAKFAKAWRV